jgi:hypothetical protein
MRRRNAAAELSLAYAFVLLVISFGYAGSRWGTVRRDRELIADIERIAVALRIQTPPREWSMISICPAMWENWALHAYMARYLKVSLDTKDDQAKILLTAGECHPADLSRWTLVSTGAIAFRLYTYIAADRATR